MFDFAAKAAYQSKAKFSNGNIYQLFFIITIGRVILPIIPWLYTLVVVIKKVNANKKPVGNFVEDVDAKRERALNMII